jgi:hypothetical protein
MPAFCGRLDHFPGVYLVGDASSVALLSMSRTAAAALPLVLVLFVVAYARSWLTYAGETFACCSVGLDFSVHIPLSILDLLSCAVFPLYLLEVGRTGPIFTRWTLGPTSETTPLSSCLGIIGGVRSTPVIILQVFGQVSSVGVTDGINMNQHFSMQKKKMIALKKIH